MKRLKSFDKENDGLYFFFLVIKMLMSIYILIDIILFYICMHVHHFYITTYF
jgi:hypothetical protein